MRKLFVAAAIAAMGAASSAFAALPSGVDTAITAIQTDAATLSGYVAPVMLAILGFGVSFKLIKRFVNKI